MYYSPCATKNADIRQISSEIIHSGCFQQPSFLERSGIHPRVILENDAFGTLNSLSIKNLTFSQDANPKDIQLSLIQRDCHGLSEDDPLYNVLSLMRGQSECWPSQNMPEMMEINQFLSEPTTVVDGWLPNTIIYKMSQSSKNINSSSNFPIEEDLSSNCQMGHGLIRKNEEQQQKTDTSRKPSTKNVTKNMGKLLFKFIWKNKMQLRKQMNIASDKWEQFISLVRVWKKENNVTRQYLLSKWQANRTFRMISHHFFRKRGLSSIFESKIEHKQMHIERLKRFAQATFTPTALDTLND